MSRSNSHKQRRNSKLEPEFCADKPRIAFWTPPGSIPPESPVLDLALLDPMSSPDHAIILAHSGGDFATAHLPLNALPEFQSFAKAVRDATLGAEPHPEVQDCIRYGQELFEYLLRDAVAELYHRLPPSHLRLQILAEHPELAALPWEFLQEPGALPGPRRDRTIARIVSSNGRPAPEPSRLTPCVRVLFVSAAPSDQSPVDFNFTRAAIEHAFRSHLPSSFSFQAVNGATPTTFRRALAEYPFDVLHFNGHGDVSPSGVGRLLFNDAKTGRTTYIQAPEFCRMVAGLSIRLVVLSACDTATGDFSNDFSVLAAALVRAGIPAVVANQFPLPNSAVAPFTGGLYRALLRDGDIDRAVAEGRLQLADDLQSFEWAIPVLYRHYHAATLFRPEVIK